MLKIKDYFEKNRIKSTIYDLVVTKKNIDLGSIVLASQTKLLDVIALDDVKLVLKFDEKYWQKVKVGQTFNYKVDGSDKSYEAKITKFIQLF